MADQGAAPAGSPPPGEKGDRRQFLKWLSGGFLSLWALGGAGALAAYLKAPERNEASAERMVSVGRLEDLRVGEARLVQHGIKPFYVLRLDATRVLALSAVCTHMRCILNFDRERKGLLCPCHVGRFDLNGNVVSGPPQRALPNYEVQTRAGEVFVRV
jgi:cytochrome b6-f complex iron-sulfur subunit